MLGADMCDWADTAISDGAVVGIGCRIFRSRPSVFRTTFWQRIFALGLSLLPSSASLFGSDPPAAPFSIRLAHLRIIRGLSAGRSRVCVVELADLTSR
jgi:hypothetical protein